MGQIIDSIRNDVGTVELSAFWGKSFLRLMHKLSQHTSFLRLTHKLSAYDEYDVYDSDGE